MTGLALSRRTGVPEPAMLSAQAGHSVSAGHVRLVVPPVELLHNRAGGVHTGDENPVHASSPPAACGVTSSLASSSALTAVCRYLWMDRRISSSSGASKATP